MLLNRLYIDWYTPFFHNTSAHALRKDLEKRDRLSNAFEVRKDFYPNAELAPLDAGGVVILVYCS